MSDPYLDELDRLIARHRGAAVEGLRMAREAYLETVGPMREDPVLEEIQRSTCSQAPGDWQEHEWGIDGRCIRCGVARTD